MKILNLYAGIGGNRKLWGEEHDITAVELNPEIAAIYQDYFPNDTVIVADAHEFLLKHFKEFEFIWSSPPCPTHSSLRVNFESTPKFKDNYKYPDMKLYQEIIFLNKFFRGLYCVENVIPYYKPLISAKKLDRHLYWANFNIGYYICRASVNIIGQDKGLNRYGFDLSKRKIKQRKDQILRNCVNPELGLYILNCALGKRTKLNEKQIELFQ